MSPIDGSVAAGHSIEYVNNPVPVSFMIPLAVSESFKFSIIAILTYDRF